VNKVGNAKYQAKTLKRDTIAGDSPGSNLIPVIAHPDVANMGESYP
jgi:hypothetical protein